MFGLFGPILFSFSASVLAVDAATNRLNLQQLPQATQFQFTWVYQGKPQTLSFSIPNADLLRGAREFGVLDTTTMHATALKAAQAKAQQLSTPQLRYIVKSVPNGYQVQSEFYGAAPPADSVTAPEVKTIEASYKSELESFLTKHFYMLHDTTNIMPDHPRIALRYARALAPMIQAIRVKTQGMSQREQINWIMGFLQSIPYDTLQNRRTSNGSGFQTPYALLRLNRGDCDTKSVALLAILRGLYPNLPLAMIYVDEHAFVGIGIPQGPKDYALKLNNRPYVLADPTGPSQIPLGVADNRALRLLKSAHFFHKPIP